MPTTRAFKITLPEELAQLVEDKVSSGEYADESAVIGEGLRELAARDVSLEKWLRDEVVPTIEAHDADPARAIPIEDVRTRLNAYMNSDPASKPKDA